MKLLSLWPIAAVFAGLLLYSGLAPKAPTAEQTAAAQALAAEGALLVDVRTPMEYQQGHAAGAVNIPLSTLPSSLAKLGDPGRPIFLYCRTGNRSGQAAAFLRARGFTQVTDLETLATATDLVKKVGPQAPTPTSTERLPTDG